MNKRTEIREYIKQRLLSRTSAGDNIRISRSSRKRSQEGSFIEIYIPDEKILTSSENETPSYLKRSLDILIEISITTKHMSEELLESQLDSFANEVEKWLPPDSLELDYLETFRLENSKTDINSSGELLDGHVYLIYTAIYESNVQPSTEFQEAINNLKDKAVIAGEFVDYENNEVEYDLENQ